MSLNIKDPATGTLARKLAQETGESLTSAVAQALRERLARLKSRRGRRSADGVLRAAWALPRLDARTPEQILGYDDRGLPR
jgi:antitoxin VapB